jgi:para-aminobenzoate synthetase component 1
VEKQPFPVQTVDLIEHRLLAEDIGDDDFLSHARSCISQPFSAVLLSGGRKASEREGRYSIAAWAPLMTFESKGRVCTIRTCGSSSSLRGDPLEVLDRISGCFSPTFPLVTPPFSGGAVGYFAYDLKNEIERLPRTAVDDLALPDVVLFWPGRIIVYDRLERSLTFLRFASRGDDPLGNEGSETEAPPSATPAMSAGKLISNFSHEDYLGAVGKARHYIGEGDIYQVNLSQRFQFPFNGDPFQLWKALFTINPAPFYAYFHGPDHHVLSTSMERFLYRSGDYIETRPIKGTRKRGNTGEQDEAFKRELLRSPKDAAELSMIVDLLRNDLGRVCSPGTIRVLEHKRLETYQNVHHLVSIVAGRLRPEATHGDLLRATFPGGSITGCPKIRSMEIIDELEPNVRHVYTGSIGYLGWHENLDLNVAIRTALIHEGTCYFSVGGGIVYDSVEEDEYQETLHKGRTLFDLIERLGGPP